jgi:hypothetical protein
VYTLRFTQADLECNRQGYLSEEQRQKVNAHVRMMNTNARRTMGCFAVVLPLMLIVGVISEVNNAGGDLSRFLAEGNRIGFLVTYGMFFLICLVAGLYTYWTTQRYSRGNIRSVEGVALLIQKDVYVRGMKLRANNLELRRGRWRKTTFRFQDAESLRYFKDGRRYRVYYLPYAIPQALSAERIEG